MARWGWPPSTDLKMSPYGCGPKPLFVAGPLYDPFYRRPSRHVVVSKHLCRGFWVWLSRGFVDGFSVANPLLRQGRLRAKPYFKTQCANVFGLHPCPKPTKSCSLISPRAESVVSTYWFPRTKKLKRLQTHGYLPN